MLKSHAKNSIGLLLAGSFLFYGGMSGYLCQALADTVKAGTVVPVKFTETMSSKNAFEGQTVLFTVTQDIKDPKTHNIVIKAGTSALGQVSKIEKTGVFGKKGELGINIQQTTAVDGSPISLQATAGKDGQAKRGTAIGWGIVGGFLFLPFALFMLKKGKNAEIPAGSQINAYVVSDVEVAVH